MSVYNNSLRFLLSYRPDVVSKDDLLFIEEEIAQTIRSFISTGNLL